LVALQKAYNSKGLEIVCFPCNQFGKQEPGTPAEIKKFAADFGDCGTMMDKIDVNGGSTSSVWKFLKGSDAKGAGDDVGWNFAAKFIIDKEGKVVERNGSNPSKSEATIKALLA